jgi:hypothetical protein
MGLAYRELLVYSISSTHFQRCGFEMLERTMLQDVPISVLFRTLP